MKYRMIVAAGALALALGLGSTHNASAQGGVPDTGVRAATSPGGMGMQRGGMQRGGMQSMGSNKMMMKKKRSSTNRMMMRRNGGM